MNYDQKLRYTAKCLAERIENMKQQDRLDGKTNATLENYIFWALEEVTENDNVFIDVTPNKK